MLDILEDVFGSSMVSKCSSSPIHPPNDFPNDLWTSSSPPYIMHAELFPAFGGLSLGWVSIILMDFCLSLGIRNIISACNGGINMSVRRRFLKDLSVWYAVSNPFWRLISLSSNALNTTTSDYAGYSSMASDKVIHCLLVRTR